MDILTRRPEARGRIQRLIATSAIAVCALTSFLFAQTITPPDVALKAAFLFNFAKFTEWPALPSGALIVVCVVGNDGIATALDETIRGQTISGHAIDVQRPQDGATWRLCQLLFIADAATRRSADGLAGITTLPVLTVSDGKGFSQTGGIIELYVEGGRMRFAINMDAAERAGLRLSSRLLGLAKIIRNGHGQ